MCTALQTWPWADPADRPGAAEFHRASSVSSMHCSFVLSHQEHVLVPRRRSAGVTAGAAVVACMTAAARSWHLSMPGWSVLQGRRTSETSRVAVDSHYSWLHRIVINQSPRSLTSHYQTDIGDELDLRLHYSTPNKKQINALYIRAWETN